MLPLQEVGTRKVVSQGVGEMRKVRKTPGALFNMRPVSVHGIKILTHLCNIFTDKANLLRPSIQNGAPFVYIKKRLKGVLVSNAWMNWTFGATLSEISLKGTLCSKPSYTFS